MALWCSTHGLRMESTVGGLRYYCPECVRVYQEMMLDPGSRLEPGSPTVRVVTGQVSNPAPEGSQPWEKDWASLTDHGHESEAELRKCGACNPGQGTNLPPLKGEVFEARFDGELCYDGSPMTVRVWCPYRGDILDMPLLALKRKFDQVMEIGIVEGQGPELKHIARMISKLMNGATVELITDNKKFGKFGIVYYPEWP